MTPRIDYNPCRPVRVCFMIDSLKPAGTETQLLALIRHLDRSRVQPALCLLDGEDETSRALEPKDCPVLRLGVRGLSRPATLAKAWRLARFLRSQRIDVLQVYFLDSTYLGVLVGRLTRVPWIVRTRNNIGYWTTPWHRCLGRWCNRLADGLVANCQACAHAVTHEEGLSPRRIIVLENGVDLNRFPDPVPIHRSLLTTPHSLLTTHHSHSKAGTPVTYAPGSEAERRIGVIANLRPVKDLDVFVRAAAQVAASHPQVTFHIAGEGELRPALEKLADQLGLANRLFLPGTVQDVPGFLAKLDVAVLCSRSEGMSNAILEYMAAGKAIVATAVGGNVQLLQNEQNALLIPAGDPQLLAQVVRRLLDDPPLALRLAQAARRRVEGRYSRQAMVRRFEGFYQDLLWGTDFPCRSTLPSGDFTNSKHKI
jgi:glycosyltransferase involved in cell wall biosynthesis